MLRLDDWQCLDCATVDEHLTDKGLAKAQRLPCKVCEEITDQRRLMSAPARYLGKRIRQNYAPTIYGGKYDTMGYKSVEPLPELPGAVEADRKYTEAIENCKTHDEIVQVTKDHQGDAPSLADYREFHKRPEWQEQKRERNEIKKQNQEKRERAEAGVPVREKPCAGDAKELH